MTAKLSRCLALGVALAGSGMLRAADDAETRFNFATGLLIKHEYAMAADEFDKLLADHPGFAQADVARYRLGEASQKAGDQERARKAFEKLLADFPKSERAPQSHYWMAQLLTPQKPAEAAVHYEAIVAGWPDHNLAEAASYGVAETRFKAGDWPAAIAACDALLKLHPASSQAVNAWYTRGWAAFQKGDWEVARASFATLAEKFPNSSFVPEARLKTAQALEKLGRPGEALPVYAELAAGKEEIGTDAAIGRATLLFGQGDKRAAAAAFEEVVPRLEGDPRQPACLMNAGHAWMATNDFDKAAAAFTQMLQKHPGHDQATAAAYWLGVGQLRGGKPAEALKTLSAPAVAEGLPAELGFDLRLVQAEAHAAKGDFAAAAKAYGAARAFQPANPRAPDALAGEMAMHDKAGDAAAAAVSAAAFLKDYPAHPRAAEMGFWNGEFLFRQQKTAEARAAFEAFVKGSGTHPLVPDARYKLGWCARAAGDAAAARQGFRQVREAHPDHPLAPEAAFREGEAAETAGDAEGALAAYAEAVRLSPEGSFASSAKLARIVILLGRRGSEAALKEAADFIRDYPQSLQIAFAHLYRGEALAQLERYEEALAQYRNPAVAQGTTGADALFGAGWCLRALGRQAEAAESFTAAAAAFGKAEVGGAASATGAGRGAEAAWLAARALEDAGEFARARTAHGAVARDGRQPEARREEAAYREALCAWKGGDANGALPLLAALAARQPPGAFAAQALYDQAWILMEQKKMSDAEGRFKDLLTRFPGHALAPDVNFRLGELAYGRDDFAVAVSAYEAALKGEAPAFAAEVLYKLGWALAQAGRPDEAIAAFARLAGEHPDTGHAPEARYRQAHLLFEAKRHEQAIAALAGIGEGPFAERAALLKAEALRATGKHREALQEYDRLLKTWPVSDGSTAAQLGRGHSLRAVGAHKDALDAYAAVITATTGEEAAQATLGQGYSHFAMQNWGEAAKAFLKVDILYGYDELKAEALDQLALTWEKAGDAEKAARYRQERAQRYPEAKL